MACHFRPGKEKSPVQCGPDSTAGLLVEAADGRSWCSHWTGHLAK